MFDILGKGLFRMQMYHILNLFCGIGIILEVCPFVAHRSLLA